MRRSVTLGSMLLSAPVAVLLLAGSAAGSASAVPAPAVKCTVAASGQPLSTRTVTVSASFLESGRLDGTFEYHDAVAHVDVRSTHLTSLVVQGRAVWLQGIATIKRQSARFGAEI